MYLFSRRPVYAAVFIALTGQAIAESTLPPIFITAGRVAEPVEETLFSTSTVTREDIEKQQPRDLGDILGQLPGIQIGRNGGAGQVTSAFIRGAASDHTLLLVDGIPVNSGTVGQPALEHFMPDQIDRIEVVRGPASTLYGSSAIGGVVQIFTKRRTSGQSASITAGGGSENSRNVAGSFDYGKQGTFANLSFSYRDTDGYEVQPSLLASDRGYENSSFNGALGRQIGDLDIELSYFQSDGVAQYVGFTRPPFPAFGVPIPVDQDTLNSVARVALTYDPANSWRSRLLLSRVRDEVEQNQFEDFAKTARDYIDWQNTVSVDDNHTLVGGVTADWTDTELLSFGSGYDERIRSIEYYLQDTIDLGDSRFQLGGRIIDNEVYGTNYTWNLAVGHRLASETRLHANAGTAFRTPSANDLYGSGGNPDFDPETSTSIEAGVTHAVTPFDSFRLVGFRTEIKDLIESEIVPPFAVTQTEEARITGLELGYDHRSSHWAWTLDYTYMDPKNLDVDQLLARRARNTFDAALGYESGKWWTQANLLYQSERRNSRFSDTILASYTKVDLSAGYRFSPSTSVTGRVQNLFDEDYELAATYPAQGRFFSVQLDHKFDGP